MNKLLSILLLLSLSASVAAQPVRKPGLPDVAGPTTLRELNSILSDQSVAGCLDPVRFGADPTHATSSTRAFADWWAAVIATGIQGCIPAGRYKLDGNSTVQWNLARRPLGVIVRGSSMGATVLDFSLNTASPAFFIGGLGGTAASPTLTNYSEFGSFTVNGNTPGTLLQLGRNGPGVGLADALDSFHFSNLIVTNANAPAVGAVTRGTAGVCRYTVPKTAGIVTGDTIFVSGIAGATGVACNGGGAATVVDATTIERQGTTFAGPYVSGGTLHSNGAAATEINNVVNSQFNNVVSDAGIASTALAVTGAVGSGSGSGGSGGRCRLTVSSTAALVTDQPVTTAGIGGAPGCNGTHAATVVDGTTLELQASTFSGAYTAGGTVTYWTGFGDALRIQAGVFNSFSGSVGVANRAVHYALCAGCTGIPYGNTFRNMDFEFVNAGVVRSIPTGPETYIGGQWAITGTGYLLSSAAGSGGNLTAINPNLGSPGNSRRIIDPANGSQVQVQGFYANRMNVAGGGAILTPGQYGSIGSAFDGAVEFGFGLNNTDSGSASQVYLDFLRNGVSVGTLTGTDTGIGLTGLALRDVAQTYTAPSIGAGTLTLDLRTGTVFNVANTANITTFTIRNAVAGKAHAFDLYLTANGTGYTQAWGASVLWPGGVAPTLTTTRGKRDILRFSTNDGGTTWFGTVVGQSF